jgi:hypothetical protein
MNSILADQAFEERPGYWGLLMRATQTPGWMIFDISFGIIMPLFCFYYDPGIIRGTFDSTLGRLGIFIYGFSGIAILSLSTWLVLGHRIRSLAAIFGGVLVAGAIISFSIGVLILPLTLIGILFVIGVLGLVPFVTGFVYLRHGLRAIRQSGDRSSLMATVILSAILAVGLPGSTQWAAIEIVERSIAEILDRDSQAVYAPVARIKLLRSVVDTDRFVREYEKESSAERKQRLARAYKEITGEEIEMRLSILND